MTIFSLMTSLHWRKQHFLSASLSKPDEPGFTYLRPFGREKHGLLKISEWEEEKKEKKSEDIILNHFRLHLDYFRKCFGWSYTGFKGTSMVLVIYQQYLYIIDRRNILKNPAMDHCNLKKIVLVREQSVSEYKSKILISISLCLLSPLPFSSPNRFHFKNTFQESRALRVRRW